MKRQGNIGECGDHHHRHDDGRRVGGGCEPSESWLKWKPDAEPEQERQGDEPARKPERVDDVDPAHVCCYRRASVRMLRRRHTRMTVKKNPRSDKNTAPVAKGVK